ncbi:MAG: zinc ribbon domain-containing protein [Clostridia bacterium]|nr:zinc ribbon domain-containing protein [Clostridia bacterium]
MGAMLVGLITGIPAMIIVYSCLAISIVMVVSTAFVTHKLKMSVLWWTIAAYVLNIVVLIPFIYALKQISKEKICPACGSRSRNKAGFCPACGANSKVFNEKKFIQKILLIIGILTVIAYVFSFLSKFAV